MTEHDGWSQIFNAASKGKGGTSQKSADGETRSEPENKTEADPIPEKEHTDQSYLDGIDDGCGCTEVWEYLSEQRSTTENTDRVTD